MRECERSIIGIKCARDDFPHLKMNVCGWEIAKTWKIIYYNVVCDILLSMQNCLEAKHDLPYTCSSAKNIVRGNDPVLIWANCARFFYAGEPINLFNQLLFARRCALKLNQISCWSAARPANLSADAERKRELVNGSIYLIMDPFSGCAIKQAKRDPGAHQYIIKT